jgi:hypothetical protein
VLQKNTIENYFVAEKTEAIVFIVIGILACGVALSLNFWHKSKWSMGIAIPLVLLALVQIAVGLSVYRKSDKMRTDAVYAYDLDPAFLKNIELPRMNKVMANFKWYKTAEIMCFAIGLCLLFFLSPNPEWSFWKGLGWGLIAQSFILLVLDFFAERRGNQYVEDLVNWLNR